MKWRFFLGKMARSAAICLNERQSIINCFGGKKTWADPSGGKRQ